MRLVHLDRRRKRTGGRRCPPARAALAALALALPTLAPGAARSDVEDLTPSARRSSLEAPTLVLRAEGGSDFSPFGNLGACLSYFNGWSGSEVELGAGGGFPGLQLGLAVRKLLGERGDFFASEIALGYNSRTARGVDPYSPGSGTHLWLDLGLGFEHRAGFFSLAITGGLTLVGFSQTPQGFVHGGIGFGI